MNPEINKKWDEAGRTGQAIPIGNIVVCDVCNDDYTDCTDVGGFIFGSYAYCPKCAASHLPKIEEYGELHFIRSLALPGEEFRAFVIRLRGPDASIRIGPLPNKEDAP